MLRRLFALLDSPHLARVGNAGTLLKLFVVGFFIVIAAVATAAQLLPGQWWVPLVCLIVWLSVTLPAFVAWRRNLAGSSARDAEKQAGSLGRGHHPPALRVPARVYDAEQSSENEQHAAAVEPLADALGEISQGARRDFMDELGRLREEGRALRRAIELPPREHPARSLKEMSLRGPRLIPHEKEAEDWARRVRAVIDRHAPRFLVLFDQGSGLPERDPSMLMTPVAMAMTPRGTRAQLEAFLKLRLQQIDRIMTALHASDT